MLLRDTVDVARSIQTPVYAEDLLRRICVRPPYFALRALSAQPGTLSATVSAERPATLEHGPMQATELSRHAAIAGLCVAALAQPDDHRRYYLAQRAHFEGYPSDAPYGAEVALHAELLELGKREARARITARAAGQVIAVITVLYSVLPDAAFARLFRSHERPDHGHRPLGAMPLLPVSPTQRRGDTWTRVIEAVPEAACAGHFERFPALPVAVLMGQLCELAGQALGPGRRYVVADGQVDAHDFCWAGERATFAVTPQQTSASRVVFRCVASAAEREVGTMTLTLYLR